MTRLKQERLLRNLSLRQLANLLGFSFQYVCLLENGKRSPSFKTSATLKAFFGIPAEQLLETTENS